VIVGIAGRLLPHPPNFTPMEAVSLYAGAWASHPILSLGLSALIMGVTDFILGWHALWPFTWGSLLLGIFLGRYAFRMQHYLSASAAALTQAMLFFLITNFGVWTGGWYGYDLAGLWRCYVAAIPFFHYQVLGALFYTSLFWALYYKLLPWLTASGAAARTIDS